MSISEMIDERAPVEKEKERTPTSMIIIAKIFSENVVIGISP